MERYIGLDVHAQTTTIVVMTAKGKHLAERVVETHGKKIVETILSFAGEVHVCLEEGMHSEWLHELLQDRVARIMVVVPPERTGTKNDSRDAWWLADQMRLGVPQRQVFKSKLSGLREAVRGYEALTKHSTRAKLQLRFLARGRGLQVARSQLLNEEKRNDLIAELPIARRPRAKLQARLVDDTEALRAEALEQLENAVKKAPDVRRLMDVPGIGLVRAAQIVSAVVTPHRFRTRQQFWAYSGLGIVTRSTSNWRPTATGTMSRKDRDMTRGLAAGNPSLKCAFRSAALVVVTNYPKHPWTIAFQRSIDEGKRRNLALLTLARKIAETVLHIWKNKEEYDSSKHKTQDAA